MSRKSGVELEPLHNAQFVGIVAIVPDHIIIPPIGTTPPVPEIIPPTFNAPPIPTPPTTVSAPVVVLVETVVPLALTVVAVTFPVTFPVKAAVIVPAAKFPLASRRTKVLTVFAVSDVGSCFHACQDPPM